MIVKDTIYVDGAWIPSTGIGDPPGDQLDHRRGDGHHPRRDRRGRGQGGRRGQAGLPGLGQDLGRGAGQVLLPYRRGPAGPHRRDRHPGQPGSRDGQAAERDRPGRAALQLVQLGGRGRRRLPLRGEGRQLAHRARAGRRGRLHHPVELSRSTRSPPRSPTPWPPAARSSSSRPRSLRSTPTCWPRSSTTSACRPACSTWCRVPDRSSARPSPATPTSTWCPSPARPGPASGWPSCAAARIAKVALELGGKSANVILDGRRLREGGRRRGRQGLPQLGPDVLGPHPDARAPRPAGRGRGHRRPRRPRR